MSWFTRLSVAVAVVVGAGAAAADELPPPEREKLKAEAARATNEGATLYERGQPADGVARFRRALEIYRQLYPADKHPAGHPDIAKSLSNLGVVVQATGDWPQARTYFEQALAMRRALYPKDRHPAGHLDVASSLNNLGALHQRAGNLEQARDCLEEALAMFRGLFPRERFPAGHPNVAATMYNLSLLFRVMRHFEKARDYAEQALAMYRGLIPKEQAPAGHPHFANALNHLGEVMRDAGDFAQARRYYDEATEMLRRVYPKEKFPAGHPDIVFNLNGLAAVAFEVGDYEKARGFYEQALVMARGLYPKDRYPAGHPQIASVLGNLGGLLRMAGSLDEALRRHDEELLILRSLHPKEKYPAGHAAVATALVNLGGLMKEAGNLAQARTFTEQGLAMFRGLYPAGQYPAGHPDLANALQTLGAVHMVAGDAAQGRSCFEQALEIWRRQYPADKYPAGHPDLAAGLTNLGTALQGMGKAEAALTHLEQGLAMYRRFYPKDRYPAGHPHVVASMLSVVSLLHTTGADLRARAVCAEALAMQRALALRYAAASSEADGLAFVQSQPAARDLYLSLAAGPADADGAFAAVWQTKAAMTRVLERRHANARAAGTAHAAGLERLAAVRRRIDQLLAESRLRPAERDELLTGLVREQEDLERSLAAAIPPLRRWKDRDALGPNDLVRALPAGAAFIDLVRYTRVEPGPRRTGAEGVKLTDSYVAFVLAPGRPVARIDLGGAAAIDRAVGTWRAAIEARDAVVPDALVRFWRQIAAQLPAGTHTLYLSPDGDLARVPFCALPGAEKGTVLLEEFRGGMTVVPHGPFLLEHLRFPPAFTGAESVLAVGAVDYGQSGWPALPGTVRELAALTAIRPAGGNTLGALDATPRRLSDGLRQARYVHVATHGQFKVEELTAERARQRAALAGWQVGAAGPRPLAAKNPLGFVGLVLSRGEVLTGLSLIELPLENLKLVTLSACETGLGESTGGEGVQGLQRAFHLAGCPNVVASLWKVNDAATAALMAKFYHELWVAKKPPIAALREAQLTIYRHPELIPALAGERGAPDLKKAVAVKSIDRTPDDGQKRADTKLWAAFVLSGAGK